MLGWFTIIELKFIVSVQNPQESALLQQSQDVCDKTAL